MKPAAFDYVRPEALEEVYALLDEHGDDARILAGGQSLMAGLNMRLSEPELLIDINRIAGLAGVLEEEDHIRIGALTRHAEIGTSPVVAAHLPLLAQAVPYVAHAAIRNRGTFGGSLANADPAAELPACAVALNGEIEVGSSAGIRTLAADEFFHGFFETGLAENEVLLSVRFAKGKAGACSAFEEVTRRSGDFASVGIAVHGEVENGVFGLLRLVFFGLSDRPVLAVTAAAGLAGRRSTDETMAVARAALDTDIEPMADLHNSVEMKRHLAGVVLERSLNRLGAQA